MRMAQSTPGYSSFDLRRDVLDRPTHGQLNAALRRKPRTDRGLTSGIVYLAGCTGRFDILAQTGRVAGS
jgi:hypothetical protein